MKTYTGFAWECSCGHLVYSEFEPEECLKCGALDSFIKLPEELLAEREKDFDEESNLEKPAIKIQPLKKKSVTKKSVSKKSPKKPRKKK